MCAHQEGYKVFIESNEEGGAGGLQVHLIIWASPPPTRLFFFSSLQQALLLMDVLSPVAAWCNELCSHMEDALQDGPYRAIMSTPVYQFMLPTKGPQSLLCLRHGWARLVRQTSHSHFSSFSEVMESLLVSA